MYWTVQKTNEDNCYVWEKQYIETGLLERAYLQWLQGNRTSSRSIADKYHFGYETDMINLLEFGICSLKTNYLPINSIQQCENFFEKFHKLSTNQNSNKNRTMLSKVFLIGSVIHYVLCGLLRDDEHKVIDILYIDPQNNDIIYKSGSYLMEKIISNMTFESWIEMGWERSDMEKLAFDSLTGIQSAIELITQSVIHYDNLYFGRMNLLRMNLIEGFLNTFDLHVLTPMDTKISALQYGKKRRIKRKFRKRET